MMTRPTGIRCGHCQGRHATVAEVYNCAGRQSNFTQRPIPMTTADWYDDYQADLQIQRREREESERVAKFKMDRDAEVLAVHNEQRANMRYTGSAQGAVTQDGMYRNPQTGEIFKVQWNRGSGDGRRLYAKQLIMHVDGGRWTRIPLEGFLPKPEETHAEFRYAPGAMRVIRPEWRMSMEEAKAFGALYGTCLRCGRDLTLEASIERAMGSTCAKKANWA